MATSNDKEELRLRIEDLQRRYARLIDDGDMGAWPDMFTDDATYMIIPADVHEAGQDVGFYHCDGKAMFQDRVTCLEETAIYEPQRYRHVLSTTHLLESSNGTATAETSFMVVRTTQEGEMTLFATGKYRDVVEFGDGGPRFKDKLVLTDSSRVDTLIALPL